MSKKKKEPTRLIVAASEHDPDMLYATRFFAPDAFIFLEQKGKRTLVLSDLEIDRGRKQAQADEFVSLSALEREVQGKQKKAPAFEKFYRTFCASAAFAPPWCRQIFRWGSLRNWPRVRFDCAPLTDFSGRSEKENPKRNCG